MNDSEPNAREPALNIPLPLTLLIAALLAIHLALVLAPISVRFTAIERLAFIPARLSAIDGGAEQLWMWLTYAFLHGDWPHVIANTLWLAVFGSPVLKRIGLARFAALSVSGAVGSVALHLVFYWGSPQPLIGFSGVVSALTGAAARFVFPRSGLNPIAPEASPRLSVLETFQNRGSLAFIIVWFVANLLFGSGVLTPEGARIAWEAHIGGFVVGLFAFGLLDPQPASSLPTKESDEPSDPSSR